MTLKKRFRRNGERHGAAFIHVYITQNTIKTHTQTEEKLFKHMNFNAKRPIKN